jgi:hypothetical protein
MNAIFTFNAGISAIISKLEKQREELSGVYHSAIKNVEKFESIKTLYLTLKDVDKRLRDLMRCNFVAFQ